MRRTQQHALILIHQLPLIAGQTFRQLNLARFAPWMALGAGGLGLVLGVAAVVRHYRCFSLAAVLSARGDTNARLELPRPVALEKQTTSKGGEKKGIHLKSPPQLGSRALCDLAGWDFC